MLIKIPPNVNTAILALQQAGYEAYAVGGAVRDSLMGREAHDWDVATSAPAKETERVFADRRVIETGIQHGTVTVLFDKEPLEITTFRVDGNYTDNRHPDSVTFAKTVEADLSRRDFTVNAMAYNERDGLVDSFGGRADIEAGIIRCVGEPDKRFSEDALRIIRGLRFAAVLGFTIEPRTAESILKNRALLNNVAVERITAELSRLLCGENAGTVLLNFAPVFEVILPEFAPLFRDLNGNALSVFGKSVPVFEHRLAALAAEMRLNGETCLALTKRLRLSNKSSERVCRLLQDSFTDFCSLTLAEQKHLLARRSEADFHDSVAFQQAVQGPEKAAAAAEKADAIYRSGCCLSLASLKVNGKDLQTLCGAEGKTVGLVLNTLLEEVLSETLPNEKKVLIERAKTLLNRCIS